MNILVIHEVNWKKKVVLEFHEFPEILSKYGHNVTVLDFEENWTREKWWDIGYFRTYVEKGICRVYPDGEIDLVRAPHLKVYILDRIFSVITHFFVIPTVIKNRNIEAIFLYSAPTNGFSTIFWARRYKIPVIFRSIDKLHRMRHPFLRLPVYRSEQYVFRNSDRVLALTPKLKEYAISLGADPSKVEVLLPGLNTNLFKPEGSAKGRLTEKSRRLLDSLGFKPDDRIIVFIGTFFDFSGVDDVLENFVQIKKAIPDAKLLYVGDGPLRNKLDEFISKNGLENDVKITGFVDFKMVSSYINLAQVGIIPFKLWDVTAEIMPTKILQYLACGLPVVSTPLPGLMDVIEGEEQGVIYAQQGDEYIRALINIISDEKMAQKIGQNGLKYVVENHSWESSTKRLENILLEEVNRKKG